MTAYLVLTPSSDLTLAELAAWIDRARKLGAEPNSLVAIGPAPAAKGAKAGTAVSLSVPVKVSVRNLDR